MKHVKWSQIPPLRGPCPQGLNVPLKQFKTAVLVNRNHKKFPVKADFKGISLSTSLNEHVEVVLDGKQFEAYLK